MMLSRSVRVLRPSRALSTAVLQAHSTAEGVDFSLNWALAKSGVVPKAQAFRNLPAPALAQHAKAGKGSCQRCVPPHREWQTPRVPSSKLPLCLVQKKPMHLLRMRR